MEPALSSTSFEIPALSASLQAKKAGILKLVDDKAGSILHTKIKIGIFKKTWINRLNLIMSIASKLIFHQNSQNIFSQMMVFF